jgi:hypothetical protein
VVERGASGAAEGHDEREHCVERGGERFGVALNLSEQEAALKRGKRGEGELAFYASEANKLNGPMVNQADLVPGLANPSFQDNANEAIHRFITSVAVS